MSRTDPLTIREMIKKEMVVAVKESTFNRSLSINVSNGWGSMKITRQWASRYGMPDWLAGNSNAATLIVVKGLKEAGVGRGNSPATSTVSSVEDGVEMTRRFLKTDIVAHVDEFVPFSLRSLAGISGAGALYHAIARLIESDEMVETQYNRLNTIVDRRDEFVQKATNTIPTRSGEEFEQKVSSRFRESERLTKQIIREADKLEGLVAKNSGSLTNEEMGIIQDFMAKAKSGMVSNEFA